MVIFLIRLIMIVLVIFTASLINAGFEILPVVVVYVFVCVWIMVKSFDDVLWWIVAIAVISGLVYWDTSALFALSIVFVGFLFDLIYKWMVRGARDTAVLVYFVIFFLAKITTIILTIVIQHYIFWSWQLFMVEIIVMFVVYVLFRFNIAKFEGFINSYTYGGVNIRNHI